MKEIKVHCKNCFNYDSWEYSDWAHYIHNDACHAFQNRKKIKYNDYYSSGEYEERCVRSPEKINKNNDCEWFVKKKIIKNKEPKSSCNIEMTPHKKFNEAYNKYKGKPIRWFFKVLFMKL